MSVEQRTSRAMATSYENKVAAANVVVHATSTQLALSALKCDALGVSIRDFEQQFSSTVTMVNRQKEELSNHVDKIEHDEKPSARSALKSRYSNCVHTKAASGKSGCCTTLTS